MWHLLVLHRQVDEGWVENTLYDGETVNRELVYEHVNQALADGWEPCGAVMPSKDHIAHYFKARADE